MGGSASAQQQEDVSDMPIQFEEKKEEEEEEQFETYKVKQKKPAVLRDKNVSNYGAYE